MSLPHPLAHLPEFALSHCLVLRFPVTTGEPLPAFTWRPVPTRGVTLDRPPVYGWGVTRSGALVLAFPDLPADAPGFAVPAAPLAAGMTRYLRQVETPLQALSAAFYVLSLPSMPIDRAFDLWARSPNRILDTSKAVTAAWDAILLDLHPGLHATARLLRGGVARWYPRLVGRPDLAEFMATYPLSAPLWSDAAIVRLTDPATGRFPRRMAGAALLRALVAADPVAVAACQRGLSEATQAERALWAPHDPEIPPALAAAAAVDTSAIRGASGEENAAFLAEHGPALAAAVGPGPFQYFRGPADPAIRTTVLERIATADSGEDAAYILSYARVLTPDMLARCRTARDWVALVHLLLCDHRPLLLLFLSAPETFWRHALTIVPAAERQSALESAEAVTGARAAEETALHFWGSLVTRLYLLVLESDFGLPTDEAISSHRSIARAIASVRAYQQRAVAEERASRLAIAGEFAKPHPRPSWVPASGELRGQDRATRDGWCLLTWLGTSAAMAEEGVAMGHCLGLRLHQESAARSETAFFAVTLDPTLVPNGRATAEIRVANGRIVQAYGVGDAELPPWVHRAIRAAVTDARHVEGQRAWNTAAVNPYAA